MPLTILARYTKPLPYTEVHVIKYTYYFLHMQIKHLIFKLKLILLNSGDFEFYFFTSMPPCCHPIFDSVYRTLTFFQWWKGFFVISYTFIPGPLVINSLCHFCDNWGVIIWGHRIKRIDRTIQSVSAMTLWGPRSHLLGQSPGPDGPAVHFVVSEKFIEICINDSNRTASFPLYQLWLWLLVFLL